MNATTACRKHDHSPPPRPPPLLSPCRRHPALLAERATFDTHGKQAKAGPAGGDAGEDKAKRELVREVRRTAGLTDISNILWLLAFYGLARYLDLFDAIKYDHRLDW